LNGDDGGDGGDDVGTGFYEVGQRASRASETARSVYYRLDVGHGPTFAYAKRRRDNYSAVFWLNIKDENFLKQVASRPSSVRNTGVYTRATMEETR
jgi:hypothetical protein